MVVEAVDLAVGVLCSRLVAASLHLLLDLVELGQAGNKDSADRQVADT